MDGKLGEPSVGNRYEPTFDQVADLHAQMWDAGEVVRRDTSKTGLDGLDLSCYLVGQDRNMTNADDPLEGVFLITRHIRSAVELLHLTGFERCKVSDVSNRETS